MESKKDNVKIIKSNDGYYYIAKKLNSGNRQTALIIFEKEFKDLNCPNDSYYVGLVLANNRKQCLNWYFNKTNYINLELTGKGNHEFELFNFVRNSLLQFEDYISQKHYPNQVNILVEGADDRRFKLYSKILTHPKFNYIMNRNYGNKCLIKELNKMSN